MSPTGTGRWKIPLELWFPVDGPRRLAKSSGGDSPRNLRARDGRARGAAGKSRGAELTTEPCWTRRRGHRTRSRRRRNLLLPRRNLCRILAVADDYLLAGRLPQCSRLMGPLDRFGCRREVSRASESPLFPRAETDERSSRRLVCPRGLENPKGQPPGVLARRQSPETCVCHP